ncbi:kinase-like protein [Phellopilus nigrolimitatus]|nr:kinase-like protein [Phellopilus nigrolimitatus]
MAAASEERPFDVIPYEDIKGNWKKLGSGSFGNVYKGIYLGIEVAIKEVLPSNDYDVAKYFEREWRLMKECRHPNVVLYLGLSRAPEPDGRIFIISEFIENGNLRLYIHDKTKPFPWKLRISFATDIARALAYLHARKCIHRDLKGENLLVTTNGRLKITDFGFARIAARNAEESKRLTFCGTDAYMSPEILIGNEFSLQTDVFSLGIILCEIGARKLADDYTFKRAAPNFGIDVDEVHKLVGGSAGCPPAFMQLALDCLSEEPERRPNLVTILQRLRDIELEVLARPSEADDVHVGSVKFITGNKRHSVAPRIPSFGMGVGKDMGRNGKTNGDSSSDEGYSDEEVLVEAIKRVNIDLDGTSQQALLHGSNGGDSEYSTTVIRSHPAQASNTVPPSLSSILTIRSPQPTDAGQGTLPPSVSVGSIESFHTASSSISIAAATEGSSLNTSTINGGVGPSPSSLIHRFTLIKPGVKRQAHSPGARMGSPVKGERERERDEPSSPGGDGQLWSPFGFFFSSALAAKCDICAKRLGWKPVLECDDCGLRTHIKCGEVAPMDCGLRPVRPRVPQTYLPAGRSAPGSPSPLPRR